MKPHSMWAEIHESRKHPLPRLVGELLNNLSCLRIGVRAVCSPRSADVENGEFCEQRNGFCVHFFMGLFDT